MSETKPLVYLVLGAVDSGRRGIVKDLIAGGLDASVNSVIFGSADEATESEVSWTWGDDDTLQADWPAEATAGFFLADGRSDPVDLIEAFKPWAHRVGVEVARVICVVHCRLLKEHPPTMHWYDACIHFSDIVLLNRREGLENKWTSDYQARFAKLFLPCLVEVVKKGRVKNPALVLDRLTRRLSHWFDTDEDEDWKSYVTDPDTIIMDEDEDATGDEEESDAEEDEYLARHPGGGRKKVLPDIRDYLSGD